MNPIWTDPERMGGVPCFNGTRVPVRTLFDYLEGGDTIDYFLEGFPTVSRDQVLRVLTMACATLMAMHPSAPIMERTSA